MQSLERDLLQFRDDFLTGFSTAIGIDRHCQSALKFGGEKPVKRGANAYLINATIDYAVPTYTTPLTVTNVDCTLFETWYFQQAARRVSNHAIRMGNT